MTATAYNNIGVPHLKNGENDKVIEYLNKSIDIELKTAGNPATS